MYYVYMLRCQDNSLYTGIAKDLQKRMNDHFTRNKNCAKYTLNHKAQKLECAWETLNKSLASKLEYHIKQLPKNKKEDLIKNNNTTFLNLKIEWKMYNKIDISSIITD